MPKNVVRTMSAITIPPLCEVVLPVRCNAFANGLYITEPLPTLTHKQISLARAIINLRQRKAACRVLNPTNAPIFIPSYTALATISSVSSSEVHEYNKTTESVSEDLQPSIEQQRLAVRDLGIEVEGTGYNSHQLDSLYSLIYNNRDLFASDLRDLPGTDLVYHHIDTGDAAPIRQRPYRHSPEVKREIDKHIEQLLESDIIEESDSPWGSPVVLVAKKNGTSRLCIDYRRLNSVTKPVFYPLPLLEDVFQTVAENNPSIFSTIDMTSGFWQIPLDPLTKNRTAFVTHRGNYHFKRLPMGLKSSPSVFQALVTKVLRNILFTYALCYIDDVLIMSSSPEEHCEHLREVFDRFRQAKLRLNGPKSKFARGRVLYLGHVLSKAGIAPDASKVSLIKEHPVPQNTKQLRSFLGIANYYRRFIKDFSIKTAHLRSLLKRDAVFVWNSVHQEEFNFLKDALTSAPILAFPNMRKDFILTTDACVSGIAYILSQLDDQQREHVICYGGRGLRSSEVNWTVSELECLAIIEGTRAYHPYLAGRQFTIVTDHVSLTFLQSLKAGKGRLQRWALHLQGYNFTIRYKPGRKLTSADGLSRRDYPPPPPPSSDDEVLNDDAFLNAISSDPFDCEVNSKSNKPQLYELQFEYDTPSVPQVEQAINIVAISDDYDIPTMQRQCPDFQDMFAYIESGELPSDDISARRLVIESEHYAIIDNILYHLHRPRTKHIDKVSPVIRQVCLPRTLRDEVTKAYHDNNGHIGFDKTYESIRGKYFWPRMYADLSEYVNSCVDCQQTKRPVHSKKAPLKSLPVEDVFARFHLDYLGPLPPSNGYRYLLVAIDSTSLYPEIHPTKTCDAEETARILYEQVFSRYGCPLSILTDRGACFRSTLVTALCKLFKVKQIFTSSYHPQTNSRAENMNSIILKSLRIYCKDQADWSNIIPAILWSYHASTTTSTGFSPFEVVFGHKMRTAIDTSIINDVRTSPSIDAYMAQMIPKIELTREIAKQNIQDCNASTQFYYNRNSAYPTY